MPANNRFRHQSYPTTPQITPTRHVLNMDPGPVDFGRLHTHHSVRQVIVVPGTFVGSDPFNIAGTLRSVPRQLPVIGPRIHAVADRIERRIQEIIDKVADDTGNYTEEYTQYFERLVGGDPEVLLLDPSWTGQNHHFARADLAVRLLNHIVSLNLVLPEQVLLWGHSHAGNGFALLSNLLANHRHSVDRFFEACGRPDEEHWRVAYQTLKSSQSPHPLAVNVTVAAFGTPVRYGWDTDGINRLYHILFDRGADNPIQATTQPVFPPVVKDIIEATYGDWVQAFAIAGTDVVPPTPGQIERNRQIAELLMNGLEDPALTTDTSLIPVRRFRHLCARWKTGTRCHTDGQNLLVDYHPGHPQQLPDVADVFGHGIATKLQWLPAHLALLLNRMDVNAL